MIHTNRCPLSSRKALSLCTDYYVGLLQQRLLTLSADSTPEQRTQQLCITVNNMEHVRYSFTLIYEELQVSAFCFLLDYLGFMFSCVGRFFIPRDSLPEG